MLYYLDKPNYSYIVHPSNHYDNAVTETLTQIGKLVPNHISIMIEEEPKVIICNPRQIINGNPQRIDEYNCAISDYKFNSYVKVGKSGLPTIVIEEADTKQILVLYRSMVQNLQDAAGMPKLYYRNYVEK